MEVRTGQNISHRPSWAIINNPTRKQGEGIKYVFTDSVVATYYWEKELQDDQMDNTSEPKPSAIMRWTPTGETMSKWVPLLVEPSKYSWHASQISKYLGWAFEWSVHGKHLSHLISPEVHPVHSTCFPSGTESLECQMTEMDKMLRMDIIKPAHSNRTSPTVFWPRKDGPLYFCNDCSFCDHHRGLFVTARASVLRLFG